MSGFRESASVLLVRLAAPNVVGSVYLVRRAEQLAFLGGFHAFVGGSVDAVDAQLPLDTTYALEDDRVLRAAALRELFEEAGVLATAPALPRALTAELTALREATLGNPSHLARALARHELALAASELVPLGHWLTPAYTPVRFHALYFALPLPEGQEPDLWPGELTDGLWASPEEAIRQHEAGEIFLTYPTLVTLRFLVDAGGDLASTSAVAMARPRAALAGGEMAFGLHMVPGRSPTLLPATHTNSFVLGGRDLVVVDPGSPYPEEQALLFGYVDQLVAAGGRVREIWLTHHHQDHVAGVQAVRARYEVPVAAHSATRDRLAELDPGFRVERLLHDGELLRLEVSQDYTASWRVLHTPGHAPGHLCFLEPDRGLLVCGDLLAGLSTVVVAPPWGDMQAYLDSLSRLLSLPLRFVFPAHGPPFAAAHDRVRATIAHRLEREQAILTELGRAPLAGCGADELVPAVYTDVPPEMHPWAALTLRAHLAKLAAEGRVREDRGRYRLTVDSTSQP